MTPVGRAVHRFHPKRLARAVNRLYYRTTPGSFNGGVDVFAADWDTLVILDACRYDLFESVADLPGELERRQSRASNTVEFLRANVAGRDLLDTVYVTANPQFRKFEAELDAQFHAVVDLWDQGWSEVINTVLPGTVTEAAVAAASDYPDKRLVVHYNQPHVPFIGDRGRDRFDLDAIVDHPLPFWQQPLVGAWDADDDEIWAAYRENLEATLPHVERLLNELTGKTVVTADHGNMVGDRSFPVPIREYGHPNGTYTPELVTVPWHVHRSGDRRTVTPAASDDADRDVTDEEVARRLEYLGYKQ